MTRRHSIRTIWLPAALAVMVGLLMVGLGTSRAAAATDPCPHHGNDLAAVPPGCAGNPPPGQQPAGQQPAGGEQPAGQQPAGGEPTSEPTDAPGQWAKSWQEGASKIAGAAADQYQHGLAPMTSNFLPAYSIMFAIGLVVFAAVLMIQIARLGNSAVGRQELADNVPRIVFFVPALMVFPAVVGWLSGFATDLGNQFVSQAGTSFPDFLRSFGLSIVSDPNPFTLLGGAALTVLLLFVWVSFLLIWMVEDIVGQWGIYLVTLLIPITWALSLYRPNRRMLTRAVGVLLGVALVPAATRFGFWVMFLIAGDQLDSHRLGVPGMVSAIMVVALSSSIPALLSYIMPAVLPTGGTVSAGMGGNIAGLGVAAAGKALTGAGRIHDALSGSTGEAAGGEAGAGLSGGTARTGGGAGKAAGVAGGALAVAAAGYEAWQAVKGAGVSAAAQGLQAGGGGGFSDAGRSAPPAPRLPHRGGGGGAGLPDSGGSSEVAGTGVSALPPAGADGTPDSGGEGSPGWGGSQQGDVEDTGVADGVAPGYADTAALSGDEFFARPASWSDGPASDPATGVGDPTGTAPVERATDAPLVEPPAASPGGSSTPAVRPSSEPPAPAGGGMEGRV